jgi:hypothetical protein
MQYKNRKKKSRFKSDEKGTMIIPLEEDKESIGRTVKFKEIRILFY